MIGQENKKSEDVVNKIEPPLTSLPQGNQSLSFSLSLCLSLSLFLSASVSLRSLEEEVV